MRVWRSIWVALWFACLLGPAAAQVTRYDGTDMPGNDLDDLAGRARSYDDCAQRCLADGRCAAFTYNLNNRACYPKSSSGRPERNARAVSGVVSRAVAPVHRGSDMRGVDRHDATDIPGYDLQDLIGRARSYEDCAQRCLGDGRCAAFTFNLVNGACYPKASVSSLQRNDGAVSGVIDRTGGPSLQSSVTRYDATDFPRNDLPDASGGARSFEDCGRRCLADDRCAAFTYNLDNGACYPKSSAGTAYRNERAVSGIIDRDAAQRPHPGAGGSANGCSVGATQRCGGCSTACGPGQRPECSAPVEGPGGFCVREAACRCNSR